MADTHSTTGAPSPLNLRVGAAVVSDTGRHGTISGVVHDMPREQGGIRVTWDDGSTTTLPTSALATVGGRLVARTAERAQGTPAPQAGDAEARVPVVEPGAAFTVPILTEELRAGVVWRDAGSVRLRVRTEEIPRSLDQLAAHEELVIEEVAVGLPLADGEAAEPRREGEVWIIPIVEEVPVVTMQRMVTKEVRVTKRVVQVEQRVEATVRRQRVEVDAGALTGRVHAAGTDPARGLGEEGGDPSSPLGQSAERR